MAPMLYALIRSNTDWHFYSGANGQKYLLTKRFQSQRFGITGSKDKISLDDSSGG